MIRFVDINPGMGPAVNDETHNRFYGKLDYRDCNNLILKSKFL